jgi:hypothetical protein
VLAKLIYDQKGDVSLTDFAMYLGRRSAKVAYAKNPN